MEENLNLQQTLSLCSYDTDYDKLLCSYLNMLKTLIISFNDKFFIDFDQSTNSPSYKGSLTLLRVLTDEYNFTLKYLKSYRDLHLSEYEEYVKGFSSLEYDRFYIPSGTPSSDLIDTNMGV